MPLTDLTAVANLALDHLGEPYLTSYADDTGTTADAARLHMAQCVETVLEGHVWSFATRRVELNPVTDDVVGGVGMAFYLPSDCLRLVRVNGTEVDAPVRCFEVQGRMLLLPDSPPWEAWVTGTLYYAGTMVTYDGAMYTCLLTHTAGAAGAANTPAGVSASTYWVIVPGPVVAYIANTAADDAEVPNWPATFTDAVAYLLASRMAPKLTQDQNLSAALFQRHETALGKARSKDTRESRSNENSSLRPLSLRSELCQARFGRN